MKEMFTSLNSADFLFDKGLYCKRERPKDIHGIEHQVAPVT